MIKEEETFPNNKVVLVGNDFKEIDYVISKLNEAISKF